MASTLLRSSHPLFPVLICVFSAAPISPTLPAVEALAGFLTRNLTSLIQWQVDVHPDVRVLLFTFLVSTLVVSPKRNKTATGSSRTKSEL
jgi:hypothetical protein